MFGEKLTSTILGRHCGSECSNHSKKLDESWKQNLSLPHDFDEVIETTNPHGQKRRSGSFDHRSQDMVMESSFNQAEVELQEKSKGCQMRNFSK
jgi:hypothetical protein